MQSNTFDELLGLEEQFYGDGFRQGFTDGVNAGRVEGRTFGLEKGFEKYVESGKLYGRSLVWANRFSQTQISDSNDNKQAPRPSPQNTPTLPYLRSNERLTKHLRILHAVSESASLSTENTEEAVSDFDARLKRGQAKAKLIERIVGESKSDLDDAGKHVS